MSKQYQNPTSACCCGKSEHSYGPASRYSRDSSPEEEYFCPKYSSSRNIHSYRNNQYSDSRTANNQSFNSFSSERQQAHQYSKSQIENKPTVNTYCRPNAYDSDNTFQSSSLLQRANNLIDYSPESEFLKKLKQQCQFLHTHQPNMFSSFKDFVENDVSVYDCQNCTDNSASVSRREEQINSGRNKCPTEKSWKCSCNHASNVKDSNDDRAFLKNSSNVQRQCRRDIKAEESFESTEIMDLPKTCKKKKSEHVSRSKKPEKCRGRRKRKSDSSEIYDSEDQFEPTLKKPHENSCERCWRFASPSRSPVNKPDQKYNPNFRNGRSFMDLERGCGDLVEDDTEYLNIRPNFSKEKARSLSPQISPIKPAALSQVTKDKSSPVQLPMYSTTKVKELLNSSCSHPKQLEKYLSTSMPKGDSPKSKIGGPECQNILYSRPKSYNPGSSSPEQGKCSNPIDDLNVTDYKTICMKPKKQCFDTFESTNRTKSPPSLMPQSYRETCALKVRSPSGPCDQHSPKSTSELSGKKDKYDNSKLSSSKTSKNVGDLENRTLKTDSTAQGDSSLGKSARASSTPKKTSENVKSDSSKLKANQKSGAGKPKGTKPEKNTEKKTEKKTPKSDKKTTQKKTPQTSKAQANSDKNRSADNRDKVCGGDKEKSHSAGESLMKEYQFNPAANCGNTADHNRNSHPIKDCSCYPRIPRSKDDPEDDHIFCCHCDWGENQDKGSSPCKTSASVRPTCEESERICRQNNPELNDRHMNSSRNYSHTHGSTCPESSFNQSPRGGLTTLSCPYRKYYSSKISNTPDNSRYQSRESENQTSRDYRYVPGNQDIYPDCAPRKYFMFYMTKSNEVKKGDDVEVLVEELEHPCPNGRDTRTKDIAEKMKKIMECPADSMALRFQKGISEAYKTPPSSRVLYF